MTSPPPSILERRRDQMLPELDPLEIERMRRFGETRNFAQGDVILTTGQVGPGLVVILSGEVDIVRHESLSSSVIVTYGSGQFMGELAQLAGRPALADAIAKTPVQALMIAPERLRALLIAEAELGERIMRAFILRRVGLLEIGAGPIIVGRAGNGDVLRLESFLRQNGHPHQLIPAPMTRRKPSSNDFALIPPNCRSCFVRAAKCCVIPASSSLRAVLAWSGPSIPSVSTTLPS